MNAASTDDGWVGFLSSCGIGHLLDWACLCLFKQVKRPTARITDMEMGIFRKIPAFCRILRNFQGIHVSGVGTSPYRLRSVRGLQERNDYLDYAPCLGQAASKGSSDALGFSRAFPDRSSRDGGWARGP